MDRLTGRDILLLSANTSMKARVGDLRESIKGARAPPHSAVSARRPRRKGLLRKELPPPDCSRSCPAR
ncbi:hypothetical protein EVAR_27854_1 [Eumeta japonica]|uniref:Uncharacterized protein n=1 Tax=Eumeta variegata TaxID=151549 RepID=A0A4C1VK43_EUMVA|nr:hypothetical protein EVAR_27854_1 [Eumeta japonica]